MACTVVVAIKALYILLAAIGNITDYLPNFNFVEHVLSMGTTNFGGQPGVGLDKMSCGGRSPIRPFKTSPTSA
jgi:hypothetical protein